jgi:hypothetical protein
MRTVIVTALACSALSLGTVAAPAREAPAPRHVAAHRLHHGHAVRTQGHFNRYASQPSFNRVDPNCSVFGSRIYPCAGRE